MSLAAESAALAAPPPPARGWPRGRIAGHLLTGLWVLAGLGLLAFLVNSWDAELFRRYAPAYLSGLGTTLALVGSFGAAAHALYEAMGFTSFELLERWEKVL